jgi:hypothetical protein
MRTIFDKDEKFLSGLGLKGPAEIRDRPGPQAAAIYESSSMQERTRQPQTPESSRSDHSHFYPSPISHDELHDDVVMMGRSLSFEEGHTPSSSPASDSKSTKTTPEETPTMVHYRPHGIPNAKSKKIASGESFKSRRRQSTDVSPIKFVKWDRVSDKGTAPLNVEPRPTGPRSCTLCHVHKKKVSCPFFSLLYITMGSPGLS